MRPGVTSPPLRFSTWSTSTMSSMTPGRLRGSSDAGPTQAILSSWVMIAALLHTSVPVQRRPMLVSRRTVTATPARGNTQPVGPLRLQPSPAVTCALWWSTNRHPGSPERDHEPSAGGDAATNNIGSVTVLHRRLRVHPKWEDAQAVLRVFHDPAQPDAFTAR